jgi:hypothetical protein
MANPDIFEALAVKGADIRLLVDQLIKNRRQIPELVEALQTEKSAKKYAYEKILRFVSERRPDLIYPHFDVFAGLLGSENNFLKWGAIMTVANLTAADTEKKFEAVFRKYFDPISGPIMITASNIIGSSVAVVRAKPALADAITKEILKVEKAKYWLKGSLSPECRNVAIGQAIDSLDQLYCQIENKARVTAFVKRQLKNTRKPVARRAGQFLQKHGKA